MRRLNFILLALSVLGASGRAVEGARGAGFQSLSFGLDARAQGLAGSDLSTTSAASLADSIVGATFGPAGISASGTFLGQLGLLSGGLVGALVRSPVSAFGGSLTYVGSGIDETIKGVGVTYGSFSGTVGGAFALDTAFRASFPINVGGTLSFASETVSDASVSTMYGQLGAAVQLFDHRLTIATRVARLGFAFDGSTALPFDFAAGVTFATTLPGRFKILSFSTSARWNLDGVGYQTLSLGGEVALNRAYFLRVGGLLDFGAAGLSSRSSVTFGLGARVANFSFDVSARPAAAYGFDLLATVGAQLPSARGGVTPAFGEWSDDELNRLPIPRLVIEAHRALAAGQLGYARRVVVAGMTRAPDNEALLNLLDRVTRK